MLTELQEAEIHAHKINRVDTSNAMKICLNTQIIQVTPVFNPHMSCEGGLVWTKDYTVYLVYPLIVLSVTKGNKVISSQSFL